MLHLRLNALSKKICSYFSQRQIFLGQLIFLVLCAHVIIFGCVALSSMLSQKRDAFSISLAQTGQTYVLMPLQKNVDNSKHKNKKRGASSQTKSKVMDYESYQKQKKEELRKKRLLAKQSLQSKVDAKKSSIVAKKSLQQVTQKVQPIEKASLVLRSTAKPTRGKKSSPKKIAPIKQKKERVKQVVTLEITDIQTECEEQEQISPQAILEIEPVVEQQVVEQPIVEQASSSDDSLSDGADLENVIFVGYEQLDNSIIGSKIQQEILQHWNPPIGIPPGVSCQLCVHVDEHGNANSVKVTKSSGRLVYDITARKALSACAFPKEIWNKNNTITLGS
ncbi:MAG: TonB C-terminal domain-containing protein [Candidatus Dependentiae bacterium]|nr:TonB C-terminal domain-containing protein [Candidatus Dependentiae bacterium]